VASCGVANVRPGFVAPAGMNRIARFMMDPRDARTDSDWFEVVSSDDGVFGCIGLMACHDVCPKELPLLEVYAYLRRRALGAAFLSRK
jgi:fumarate reductase iron-sulfur subunit